MEMGRNLVALMVVMVALFEISKGYELCNIDENGLKACKPSVTEPNPVDPNVECCQALSGADLTCLCSYKNSMLLPTFGIDPNLAMGLPSKCNMTTPANC
ncbi:Protease inhibitor/seed storage/lipid transfer protein family protein [Quillaja saponaria]|uniref:Protease inhibitor/seed storage/lipid transfer protein family protein n=1 Tax=Quillaja saponaria TaxID=32244 RepID=A0AAD7LNY8_QUISA|nr:Protease inhibitor/seed storage/lipid transfer protein family protein [Quillaja saponaria]